MAKYNIYSFDIFDTLLLRPYTDPQEVWRVLEEREGAKGFAKARKKGDMQSYKVSTEEGRETSIEEAYNLMPKRFRPMMQKEMKLEREVLRANPEMLELWNELGKEGKRRVIVSDMYLSADFIKLLLKENGFTGWDGFYLSSERNARKTTGRLFEIMLKEEGVKASEVLHIGDNEWSDVKVPQGMGIQVQHYKKISEQLFEEFPFMRKISPRLAGTLALGWHQYKKDNPNLTYWNKLGFSMGGMLGYLYVSWIVKVAKERGINHLMFVARDGYIWKKICNTLYPEITTDYFYAPRLTSIAVLGAIGSDPIAIADRKRYMDKHLQGVNPEDVKRLYTQYLEQFTIDEHTALVDGCSSGFSAQRLVETAVGHPVFSFYLLAMAKMHNAGALYQARCSLPFQDLSEFLFGSPENPIKDVTLKGPVYNTQLLEDERFKMSVSEEILDGAFVSAQMLHKEGSVLTTDDWMNYQNLFWGNRTVEDNSELSRARNATDVQQNEFRGVMRNAFSEKRIRFKIHGYDFITSYYKYSEGDFLREHYLLKKFLLRRYRDKVCESYVIAEY